MNMIKRRNGFSVVEVLIAAVIATLVISLMIYLFSQSRSSMGDTNQKISTLQQGRMMLELLKRDLRNVVYDPDKPATELKFEHNGVRLTRIVPGAVSVDDTDQVVWAFDLLSREATRASSDGTKKWGNESVQVWFMNIEQELIKGKQSSRVALKYIIRLADAENSPRSQIEMTGRIFPPALQGFRKVKWMH
jgi:type II secretory pathway pseudopilin PulG